MTVCVTSYPFMLDSAVNPGKQRIRMIRIINEVFNSFIVFVIKKIL